MIGKRGDKGRGKGQRPETFMQDKVAVPLTPLATFQAQFERLVADRQRTEKALDIYIKDYSDHLYVRVSGMLPETYGIGTTVYIHPRYLGQVLSICLNGAGVMPTTQELRAYAQRARQLRGSVMIQKQHGQRAEVRLSPLVSLYAPRMHR